MTIDDLTEALALLPRTAELLIEIVEGESLKVSGIEATSQPPKLTFVSTSPERWQADPSSHWNRYPPAGLKACLQLR